MTRKIASRLKSGVALVAVTAQLVALSGPAGAFCGLGDTLFAQPDGGLFQVTLALG